MPRKKVSKGSNSNKQQMQQMQALLLGVLVIGLGVGGYFAGDALGWWGATTTIVVPSADDFEFYVEDYKVSGTELDSDDHEIYIYRVNTENLDEDEISDLVFADYSYDKAVDSGDDYNPDDDYLYYCKMNGSDICEYWFVPTLGLNTIYATNTTEDVAMVAFSTDELSTTILNTNYDKWSILTQTLDAAEGTGKATNKEGYMPYYDFEDDEWKTVMLKIEFNTTAALGNCDFKTSPEQVTESASGNFTYYEIKLGIFGEDLFKIDFGSGLGVTFEVLGMTIGYGSSASMTDWDTQN